MCVHLLHYCPKFTWKTGKKFISYWLWYLTLSYNLPIFSVNSVSIDSNGRQFFLLKNFVLCAVCMKCIFLLGFPFVIYVHVLLILLIYSYVYSNYLTLCHHSDNAVLFKLLLIFKLNEYFYGKKNYKHQAKELIINSSDQCFSVWQITILYFIENSN